MKKASFEFTLESRQNTGQGASRRLRRIDNKVPVILYGGGEPPVSLATDHIRLFSALEENEAVYSHILTLHINGKKERAVIKDLQRHPHKPRILHMDLLRITGKEKIVMRVPIHFVGAEMAPGLKEGGIISHLLSDIEVRCLPDDLPEHIELDVSQMKLHDSIHLSALKLTKNVEIIALSHGNDLPIVSIQVPRAEEEVPVVAEVSAADVPTIEKGKEVKDDENAPVGKTEKAEKPKG